MLENFEDYSKIVSLDSSPFVGISDLCLFYASLCERMNLSYECLEENQGIMVYTNKIDPEIFIYNDIETEEPGPHSLWDETNQNPFEATLKKERLYGLGVAGSKISFLTQLYALERLQKEGKKTSVCLFAGSFSNLKQDIENPLVKTALQSTKQVIVSRPTSSRLLLGNCGYAKVKFQIPLDETESELRRRHLEGEDTSTQTRIFRGRTTHGASVEKLRDEDAFVKLIEYLRMLPDGVLVLSMEAGHSVNAVASEAILELNLSQPVGKSVAKKLLDLVDQINLLIEKYKSMRGDDTSKLPNLNIGKLRHYEDCVELGMSFYLPHDYTKEDLLAELKIIEQNLEKDSVQFKLTEFLAGFEFKQTDESVQRWKAAFDKHKISWRTGDSVMKSASRKLSAFGQSMVQFGLASGLGNINEPNEYVESTQLKDSIELFYTMMEQS
ncbi:MAG: hypothetical protein VX642_10975 [Bdellovibrionota bacterium]|nr:hypothetical protein [Bdellovibrionota bacterium]